MGRTAPSVNLEPPHISETIRVRKLKFYTLLIRERETIPLFGNEIFSARGRVRGRSVLYREFGTPSYLGNY